MQPAVGVPLESRQEWHRNLEAAILHHSTALAKQPAISVVDPHGKVSVALTYGKLNTLTSSFSSSCNKQTNITTHILYTLIYTPTHEYDAMHTHMHTHIHTTHTPTPTHTNVHVQLSWLEGLRRWLILCFESLEEGERWSLVIEWPWCFGLTRLPPLFLPSMAASLLLLSQSALSHPLPKRCVCFVAGGGVLGDLPGWHTFDVLCGCLGTL